MCILISKGKSRKQMSSIVGQVIHYTAANVGVFTAFLRYTDIYFCEGKDCGECSRQIRRMLKCGYILTGSFRPCCESPYCKNETAIYVYIYPLIGWEVLFCNLC
uniref:Uncharacterized protein isoform X2 n=1 Tax=Nicotiana tabacum TaxID=4097 RepID=A0A1S4B3J7_TOBAC|nr:PREDICTED: uncharacterized protein LOC107804101 isoform X2 [Nicotiana tabacum]